MNLAAADFYDKFVVSSSEESDEADTQNDCNSCKISLTESFDFHHNHISFLLKLACWPMPLNQNVPPAFGTAT